jgi:ATP-dependent protease ClpP protease subunit
MAEKFPRGIEAPNQSPLFWVNQKDRYLRQLLIRDIQAETKRELIVYFTECDRSQAQIDQTDDIYLSELLCTLSSKSVDLLLETNGGYTDATEKICAVLRNAKLDLRVIVPRRAKSNGTVIAFCGTSVVMGPDSELGPIDPFVAGIPADYIINAKDVIAQRDPILFQTAQSAINQTIELATYLLVTGMLKEKKEPEVRAIVQKLATRQHYHSHGSVIDAEEAIRLGLNVEEYPSSSALWQKLWLLRTMYSFDCQLRGYSKLFEGSQISSPVAMPTISSSGPK